MTEPINPPYVSKQAPAGSALDVALTRIGDRWSLLVVDALLGGPRRFNELADAVPGIASNVLSQRLKRLEAQGLVVARPYSRRPARLAYELSGAGAELAGAVRLLAQWGARLGDEAEAARHEACGTAMEVRWYCPTCGRTVERGEASELRYL